MKDRLVLAVKQGYFVKEAFNAVDKMMNSIIKTVVIFLLQMTALWRNS